MNDLDYFSTKELIQELSKRHTFAGVVFHSNKEAKTNQNLVHEGWDIIYCNLTEIQVSELMEVAADHFKQLADNQE
jgi:hypothetical protein